MKDFYIADAARFENQAITSFFCLASISARDRKPSGQYLALTLSDKTGQFEARMWEDFADVLQTCAGGCYVKVQGQVSKYQGKFQITVTKMRSAASSEINTSDFIPSTQYDIASMAAELRGYVDAFRNPHLRRLVLAFLDDPAIGPAFNTAPAAKRLHHAWLGGLLEHVLSLVRVCLATAPFYPEVDPDLLVTGAILHDIGKIRELSWRSSFDYTLEGQLIGHISIAQGMLHEKIAQLNAQAKAQTGAQTAAFANAGAGTNVGAPGPDSGTWVSTGSSIEDIFTPSQSAPSTAPAPGVMGGVKTSFPVQTLFNSTSEDPRSRAPQPTEFATAEAKLSPSAQDSTPSVQDPPPSAQDSTPSAQDIAQDFPPQLRLLLEHMILSHHGKLEFGSPKLPMTPEAMLLSALDDLEAKFQTLRNEFASASASNRPVNEPTDWVRSMERPLFNSQAWLRSTQPKPKD